MKLKDRNKSKEKTKTHFWTPLKLFFKRVGNNIDASTRIYLRSPMAMFFSLLYPVIFILILGSLISGVEKPFSFDVYVQNHDSGVQIGPYTLNYWNDILQPLIEDVNNSANEKLINIIEIPLVNDQGENISAGQYMDEHKGFIALVIPLKFSFNLNNTIPINITVILVEESQSAKIAYQILSKIFYEFDIGFTGGFKKTELEGINILVGRETSYVEYLLPGMIGIAFMNNALIGTIVRFNYNKVSGLFVKLSSSPMRKVDYVTSEMFWQYLLATVSMLVSVFTAWIAFKVPLSVFHWMIFPTMLTGIMTFSGIGMIGARVAKSVNGAAAIGNIIANPMMFLSGAFFEISQIPALDIISKCLPLTYVVNALRDSMITNNMNSAWINFSISFCIGLFFMLIGVLVTKWKKE